METQSSQIAILVLVCIASDALFGFIQMLRTSHFVRTTNGLLSPHGCANVAVSSRQRSVGRTSKLFDWLESLEIWYGARLWQLNDKVYPTPSGERRSREPETWRASKIKKNITTTRSLKQRTGLKFETCTLTTAHDSLTTKVKMLELLLSLDHETSKLFDWLQPQEILTLTCVNRTLHQACEQWCQNEGVPRLVAMKRAEIARICDSLEDRLSKNGGHPFEFHELRPRNQELQIELAWVFESYQGFLEALLRTPLNDTVVKLLSWSKRYWMVSRPRPRSIRQHGFDYGYRRTGYWCDAFGCGAPNDYFRLVGDDPNKFWSLCLAGSDSHHIRWRNNTNNDRRSDPWPKEASKISYTQRSSRPTEWDKTRQYWRDCGARVRKST